MLRRNAACEMMWVEAVVERSYDKALRAMALNHLVHRPGSGPRSPERDLAEVEVGASGKCLPMPEMRRPQCARHGWWWAHTRCA